MDDAFAAVLGYDCTNRLFGTEIHRLIPSLNVNNILEFAKIPIWCLDRVRLGHQGAILLWIYNQTQRGPLFCDRERGHGSGLWVDRFSESLNPAKSLLSADAIYSYEVRIRSLASINGVITLTESGTMHSYNENFFHELLGMQFDEESEREEEQMSRKSDDRKEMVGWTY